MQQSPIPSRVVLILVAAALLLPITICVVFGVGSLLTAMDDSTGGGVLGRIALGCGVLWVVDLIGLVLVLAIGTLWNPDGPDQPE
jgi:hypothetical protein